MVKRVANSTMAKEIKKEYLKEHLDSVKTLIDSWIRELSTPPPFERQGSSWGWQAVYRPPLEQNLDENHMLRCHLRSRALWNHHTNWEQKLEPVWHLTNQVRKEVSDKHIEQLQDKQRQYTENYVGVALWKGFEVACGGRIDKWYKVPDDQKGVAYGAYKIEMSVTSSEERSSIEKEHLDFTYCVAGLKRMKKLVDLWREVIRLQERMQAIVSKALKSNDILYPCRFCRHLWK